MSKKSGDSSKVLVVSLDELLNQLSDSIALEILKLFKAQAGDHGDGAGKRLAFLTLTKLIGGVASGDFLNPIPKEVYSDKDKLYKYRCQEFAEAKVTVQDATAAGFGAAMSRFCGQNIDYYCQIKVVPEPQNKNVC